MKKYVILIGIAILGIVACTDRDDDIDTVNIRIKNSTSSFFSEVSVVGLDTVYTNIAAGAYSPYIMHGEAFQEMSLTVVSDSTTIRYTPSEMPTDSLPIGFYTYDLSFDDDKQLNFRFQVDY